MKNHINNHCGYQSSMTQALHQPKSEKQTPEQKIGRPSVNPKTMNDMFDPELRWWRSRICCGRDAQDRKQSCTVPAILPETGFNI